MKRTLTLLALLALALVPAALASVKAGTYAGKTSHKSALKITVAAGGKSGVFKFCADPKGVAFKIGATGAFSLVGKSRFGQVDLKATGKFIGTKVTGKISLVAWCDGQAQTFSLAHS